jgi:membrane-bound lytic murein transglycosylase A
MKKIFLPLVLCLILAGCGDTTKIKPATFAEINGWKSDALITPFMLFVNSCRVNATRENAWQAKSEGPVGVREHWEHVCGIAQQMGEPNEVDARNFFEKNFIPYKVETEKFDTGLVTGYYEPIINGSTVKKAPYLTPVYGVPQDLGERKPYYTREEIVGDAIKDRAPILFYVDDPVLLFFLHVQGSGKVRLPDGNFVGIQYAGQNGYSYTPIGRILKERGELEALSMQAIRDWLHAHPSQMNEVMNQNQSYIFFKKGPGDKAAKGAIGLSLTPLRSIAIDDDRAAYGVPTFLDTTQSEYKNGAQVPLRRLFISQDTGGALKGPHRADLFYGQGITQEWQAGHQNARAKTYWLLPQGPHADLQAPEVIPENDGVSVE